MSEQNVSQEGGWSPEARAALLQIGVDFELEAEFRRLADDWRQQTEHVSNISRAISHPAYQQIIGTGRVVPKIITYLLLHELETEPDHWFSALKETTGQDPALQEENVRRCAAGLA